MNLAIKEFLKLPQGKQLLAGCLIVISFLTTFWIKSDMKVAKLNREIITLTSNCGKEKLEISKKDQRDKDSITNYYEDKVRTIYINRIDQLETGDRKADSIKYLNSQILHTQKAILKNKN